MDQHAQLTRKLITMDELATGCLIVYAKMRISMHPTTRITYIPKTHIASELKMNKKTVLECIDILIDKGYLEIVQERRAKNQTTGYYLTPDNDKHFEMYTKEFIDLDPKRLPWQAKDFYIRIQPFLTDKESGEGLCRYSSSYLASKIGLSARTVEKYGAFLEEAGFIRKKKCYSDIEGKMIVARSYDLSALEQARLGKETVEDAIIANAEATEDLARQLKSMQKKLSRQEAQIKWLTSYNIKTDKEPKTIHETVFEL